MLSSGWRGVVCILQPSGLTTEWAYKRVGLQPRWLAYHDVIREWSRRVPGYLEGAQSRAIEKGGIPSGETRVKLGCRRHDDRVSGPDVRVRRPGRIASGSREPWESHWTGVVRAPHKAGTCVHKLPRRSSDREGFRRRGGRRLWGLAEAFVPCALAPVRVRHGNHDTHRVSTARVGGAAP